MRARTFVDFYLWDCGARVRACVACCIDDAAEAEILFMEAWRRTVYAWIKGYQAMKDIVQ